MGGAHQFFLAEAVGIVNAVSYLTILRLLFLILSFFSSRRPLPFYLYLIVCKTQIIYSNIQWFNRVHLVRRRTLNGTTEDQANPAITADQDD